MLTCYPVPSALGARTVPSSSNAVDPGYFQEPLLSYQKDFLFYFFVLLGIYLYIISCYRFWFNIINIFSTIPLYECFSTLVLLVSPPLFILCFLNGYHNIASEYRVWWNTTVCQRTPYQKQNCSFLIYFLDFCKIIEFLFKCLLS